MEIDDDKVWMTEEELDAFRDFQLQTARKLNIVLAEFCLLLLKQNEN